MIFHRTTVEHVELMPTGLPWNEPGVVAYGAVTVNGKVTKPWFLCRTASECLIPHFGALPGEEVPSFVTDPAVLDSLRMKFMLAIAQLESEPDADRAFEPDEEHGPVDGDEGQLS